MISVAIAQAKMGDVPGAKHTVTEIIDNDIIYGNVTAGRRYRNIARSGIAEAQIAAADIAGAKQTAGELFDAEDSSWKGKSEAFQKIDHLCSNAMTTMLPVYFNLI